MNAVRWPEYTAETAALHFAAFIHESQAARCRADACRLEGATDLARYFDKQATMFAGHAQPYGPFAEDFGEVQRFAHALATGEVCKGNDLIELIAEERIAAQDRADAARRAGL